MRAKKRIKRSILNRNGWSFWLMPSKTKTFIGIGTIKQWSVRKAIINLNYSPEKNGVTRLGAKLSPHPHANKDAYRSKKMQLKTHEASATGIDVKSYIRNLTVAVSIFDLPIFELNFNKLTCYYLLFLVWHWWVRNEDWRHGTCKWPGKNMQIY